MSRSNRREVRSSDGVAGAAQGPALKRIRRIRSADCLRCFPSLKTDVI